MGSLNHSVAQGELHILPLSGNICGPETRAAHLQGNPRDRHPFIGTSVDLERYPWTPAPDLHKDVACCTPWNTRTI